MQNDSNEGPNPSGLCMCGCGRTTSIATDNDPRKGILKGQHRRYLKSHHLVGVPRSEDVRRKLSLALTGKGTGENHRRWKGGVQMRYGYKNLLVGPEHPMAAGGYVAEHRLVMAEKIGRMLQSHEHVHHIDLDRLNNAPENLVLVSASQHMRIHLLIRKKGFSGVDAVRAVLEGAD